MERLYPACIHTHPSEPCTVCHDDIAESTPVRVLVCKHSYHVDCIDEWCKINASCPVCRADLRPKAM
jgi:hypothetical protein